MAKSLKPGQLVKIINSRIGDINKAFRRELRLIDVPSLIRDLILKGISPVLGVVGRFKQYSASYIRAIQGKPDFLTNTKTGNKFRVDYSTRSGRRLVRPRGLGVGKRISPVNLKVSGEMLKTLTYKEATGEIIAAHDVDGYNLWQLHNDGEGNLPERRLLPNRPGERFNRRVEQKITEALARVMGVKASRLKRFAKINYVIK